MLHVEGERQRENKGKGEEKKERKLLRKAVKWQNKCITQSKLDIFGKSYLYTEQLVIWIQYLLVLRPWVHKEEGSTKKKT